MECAYVRSCAIPELTYFAAPLELGPNGIQRHLDIPPLNDYECELLRAAVPRIKKDIKLGEVRNDEIATFANDIKGNKIIFLTLFSVESRTRERHPFFRIVLE